jgi:ABC-2 type transport system ATP-binding protein
LVHDPALILLDEPTVGVDPQSRHQIFENILALRRLGRTIIYTTHYMEEASRLCDRVAIIDKGRLLALGTVPQLLQAHGARPTLVAQTDKGEHRVETDDPLAELNRLAAAGVVSSFQMEQATLEQVFLHMTGRRLRD